MPTFHVKCYETVNFTVAIEAENEEQARELAHADINSHEVVSESTTEWDIEEVILEDEEWYNSSSEGKDQPQPVDKAAQIHVRRDLDTL
tara:strand:- start:138 stop:404 length:267 start_codon:yes stop_codon:yes gene_type:complete